MTSGTDTFALTVLGASNAFPNPGGASAGYLVQSDGQSFLVDCGHGVTGVLQRAIDLAELSGIIISHMHPDHFFDLIPLHYGYSYPQLPPVPLLLPPGGLELLERLQPILDFGEHFFTGTFEVSEYDPDHPTSLAGIDLQFARTQHFIPGYAMRFTKHDRSLFYSSDTGRKESVTDLARGSNVGLIEATVLTHEHPGPHGHLSAEEAGQMAHDASVERLILTHYWSQNAAALQDQASAVFAGEIALAQPLTRYPI
jgi:ribonuclease BN (tRNA processing enzyme)